MEEQFKVLFSGQLQLDVTPEEAIEGFVAKFGVSDDKAQALINSGRKVVIKKGLERQRAEKYLKALEGLGLIVSLEPMEPTPAEPGSSLSLEPTEEPTPAEPVSSLSLEPVAGESQESAPEAAAKSEIICPKCGSDRIENDSCLDCGIILSKYSAIQTGLEDHSVSDPQTTQATNPGAANPYAAPTADLMSETEAGEMSGPVGVPASHGWAWLVGGFWHFKRNPWAWMGAVVIFILLSIVVQLIPILGGLLITLFQPVIIAGFVLGTQEQDLDRDFRVGHLFAGFSNKNMGQLVLVGLLYLAGMFLIFIGIGVMIGGTLAATGGLDGDPEMMANMASSPAMLIAFLVGLALLIPLLMAYWFAPALVALDDLSAINAMKLSFSGCIKNILPFLIYGLAGLLLIIVGMIPLFLGLLVVMPMLSASLYVAYRDIFYS